jgi:hypothetical protein
MSFHHDPEQWLFQARRENCPYCLRAEDPSQALTLKLFHYAELCAHLHLHLFPPYGDDPFAGVAIDTQRLEPPVYQGEEFVLFVAAMQASLRDSPL